MALLSSSSSSASQVAGLYGAAGLGRLRAARVAVVGVGGVGSWAAEALVRSGVGSVVLVDLDEVCASNVNRQACALTSTVGKLKAEVMAARLRDVDPACDVRVVADFVDEDNVADVMASAGSLDFVLDAIDSVDAKAALVAHCRANGTPVVVTGGTGGADNALGVRVDDLARTEYNRLLTRLRKILRKKYGFADGSAHSSSRARKWKVPAVYIPEGTNQVKRDAQGGKIGCVGAAGSAVFVTGTVGFVAAGHVVNALAAGPEEGGDAGCAPCDAAQERGRASGGGGGGGRAAFVGAAGVVSGPETAAGARTAPALDEELPLTAVFDAHSHVHLSTEPGAPEAADALLRAGAAVALTGTRPEDWGRAVALYERHSGPTRLALGVHPWHAHEAAVDEWMPALRDALARFPHAAVGEIGLDKVAVPPGRDRVEYEAQRAWFDAQLALAGEQGRVVAVHCVKAYGDLYNAMRSAGGALLPPRVLMHSYGGSVDFVKQLLALPGGAGRFYFGFSHVVNSRNPAKAKSVIAAVPDDALLLESDLTEAHGAEQDMRAMLALMAEAKGWTPAQAAAVTYANAERFYGHADLY